MAETIKGINVVIGSDTTGLSKALGDVNKKSKDIQSELKQVERLLKLDPSNTELVAQKQKLLADAFENTKEKLNRLKQAQEQVNQQFKKGDISEGQYRAFQREVAKTEQNLESLEKQARKANAVLSSDQAIGNLKKIGMTATVAAAAVGAAFVGMATTVLNNADELQKLSDVTGLSAERLQELQYAGNNLGVELNTITGAQAKLTKTMAAAETGKNGPNAQAEAFNRLGIKVRDSNGNLRDVKAVMEEAFTALGKVGNETERDALAMQLFGKSAMEMNPLIKAGGEELKKLSQEARESGSVMSDEAIAGLDAFGDTVDNLKNSILGAFGEEFAELLPSIQAFLDNLKELPQWLEENSTLLEILGVIIATITALVIAFNIQQALLASGMTLWASIAAISTGITTALGAAFSFLVSPIALVIIAIGAVIAIGILLYKHWDTIKAKAIELWEKLKETFSNIKDSIVNKWNEVITGIKNVWNNVVSFFKNLPSEMLGFGKNIIDGLIEGIKSKIAAVANVIKGVADKVTGGIKSALGIHSPSRVMMEMGEYTGEGFINGIKSTVSGIASASQSMANAVNPVAAIGGITANTSSGSNIGDTVIYAQVQTTLDGKVIANATTPMVITNISRGQVSRNKGLGRG